MNNNHNDYRALASAIELSVKKNVEDKEVAIAFSGGVDSTTLAYLSGKYAKKTRLYTVGFPDSQDIKFSIKIAEELGLELDIYYLDEEESKALYKKVEGFFGLGFLKSEILAPIQKIFEVSYEKFVLFGSGTEELFAGYDRYYQWKHSGVSYEEISKRLKQEFDFLVSKGDVFYIKKLAELNNKTALFPFCDDRISSIVFGMSAELLLKDEEKKKYVLREACKLLGIPSIAINRPKKALQYGSGIHKKLLRMKRSGNL